MTATRLAVINYRDGGLNITGPGFDFRPLRYLARTVRDDPPAVFGVNEAKQWHFRGKEKLLEACDVHQQELGRPYVGDTGWHPRGTYGPAIIWAPEELTLRSWTGGDHETNALHGRNTALFSLPGQQRTAFRMMIRHYSFDSPTERITEAERDADAGTDDVPTVLAGDLNSTASGPRNRYPRRNFRTTKAGKRRHKGQPAELRHRLLWLSSAGWTDDTSALDVLTGRWSRIRRKRVRGAGYTPFCELASTQIPAADRFRPTTNRTGGQIIDWLLANEAMAPRVDPDSIEVHLPPEDYPRPWPLDHRMLTGTVYL